MNHFARDEFIIYEGLMRIFLWYWLFVNIGKTLKYEDKYIYI